MNGTWPQVWQWTDEFCDEHTCVSLVRGGSNYAHSPAGYYFPRPTSLSTHQVRANQIVSRY